MINPVSKFALAAALALGGASVAAPALAQANQAEASYTAEERAALEPVQAAVTAQNYAAAAAALPAAQTAVQSPAAKYRLAYLQLEIGKGTQNQQAQAAAIDAMLASGAAPATQLPALYNNQGAFAAGTGDYRKAEAAFTRLVEVAPNDPEALAKLAEVKADLKKPAEAAPLFSRAIELRAASGQPAPQSWYKRGLKIAYDNRLPAESLKLSQALLAAYPTKENWRDTLLIYRDIGNPDQEMALDTLRLMRASKSLSGERDYMLLAQAAMSQDLTGEAKTVIDEGVAARMVDPNKADFKTVASTAQRRFASTKAALPAKEKAAIAAATGADAVKVADAYYGYGDYAKAAALYRTSLQKGSVDANLVNTRLGMALALGGQKAEAEAAFGAVTGPRANLAAYWMLWLRQQA